MPGSTCWLALQAYTASAQTMPSSFPLEETERNPPGIPPLGTFPGGVGGRICGALMLLTAAAVDQVEHSFFASAGDECGSRNGNHSGRTEVEVLVVKKHPINGREEARNLQCSLRVWAQLDHAL